MQFGGLAAAAGRLGKMAVPLTRPLALQIDTLHDVAALAGALASLAAGRVGALTFVYGSAAQWGSSRLEDVVSRLEELDYACYFSGG